MFELLQMLYRYNSWANRRLLEVLGRLNDEQYNAQACSGNGTIRETLAHMLTTQFGWFSWFDKSMPPERAIGIRVTPDELSTVAAARARWSAIDEKTLRCIGNLSEEKVKEVWSFSIPGVRSASLPLWKMLLHVVNHSTHTRAQIVASVRRAGIDPGNYDMINFVLSGG
jgi:uncharacterized damage-inducible protein DinB